MKKTGEKMENKLVPPVTYQGGKIRLAEQIVNCIFGKAVVRDDVHFVDLCCGTGAVALEVINHWGIPPENVTLLDSGPWGLFWKSVADGTFSMEKFSELIKSIPTDKFMIKGWMEELATQPVGDDAPYIYLVLQAASFGGKVVRMDRLRWRTLSFRDYWQPTETSVRRHPVNPMLPMPETIYSRVGEICDRLSGRITAYHMDVALYPPASSPANSSADQVGSVSGAIIYIDPPYENTTGYEHSFDVMTEARRLTDLGNVVWVSESKPLTSTAFQLVKRKGKGSLNGGSGDNTSVDEWLSLFNNCEAVSGN